MNVSNRIIANVEKLIDTYGRRLKTDNHLLLTYWMVYDKIDMADKRMSTIDFLDKATDSRWILDAKQMIECMRGERNGN